ncbi:hypothetical protein [Maribacter dokdonensis]|uniref:hypothetical protein n=1 Tax=Maribacter dokdonensis TaxID=320912 RepID=UPI003299BC14
MNKIEKIVYDLVKSNPRVKQNIRNLYQSFFDILPNKKNFSINKIDLKEGYFYGFHDVTPFSEDSSKLLANKITIPLRMPERGDVLEVGYFNFDNGIKDFIKIGETLAWNYHKGCRLQWLKKNCIIYNHAEGDNLISCIHNIEDNSKKSLPFPIDSVSPCGQYISTFSYGRLEKLMPGYGYRVYDDISLIKEKTSKNTGLFLGDVNKKTKELILSLQDLAKIGDLSSEDLNCHHYVTHSLFSPDGKYISFLHRWVDITYTTRRHTRLLTINLESRECFVAPTNDMVSHYVWNKQNQIIAYSRVGNIDSHVLFEEPTLQKYRRIAYPKLNSDGHQSFISNDSFITDTYPDKNRMANLYKVDCNTENVTLLAKLNSYKKFQSLPPDRHWCCDLHPRMNSKGDLACFDSVHTGNRAICVMKI